VKNNQKGVYTQRKKIQLPERWIRYNTCLSLSSSYLYNEKKKKKRPRCYKESKHNILFNEVVCFLHFDEAEKYTLL
jgi:hypothetical protein